jgi:hypothetical protein
MFRCRAYGPCRRRGLPEPNPTRRAARATLPLQGRDNLAAESTMGV